MTRKFLQRQIVITASNLFDAAREAYRGSSLSVDTLGWKRQIAAIEKKIENMTEEKSWVEFQSIQKDLDKFWLSVKKLLDKPEMYETQ